MLEREAAARAIPIPRGIQDLETDLQRLSARISACGLEDPFQEEALKATPPAVLRGVLTEARGRGLLEAGPAWTRHGDQLPDLAEGLRRTIQHQVALEPSLADGLAGRGRGL